MRAPTVAGVTETLWLMYGVGTPDTVEPETERLRVCIVGVVWLGGWGDRPESTAHALRGLLLF